MSLLSRSRRRRSVVELGSVADPGNKARNLKWLEEHGALVPRTWVVDSVEASADLELPPGDFAVRSSSAAEDTVTSAGAGRFLTELDVAVGDVPGAVGRVLASSDGPMAVMIQPMIVPVVSGVVFSRNPVTGLSDIIVEAVEGSGEALLQDGDEPMRWVYRNGEFTESPRSAPDLPMDELIAETKRLSDGFGPADLEWVWDGERLFWVQIRPITTIGDVPIYSRRIAKDVMPGLIKPLVWSVNVPMVNAAWVRLFTEAIGPNELDPNGLARSFAYRSYFDMRAIGDVFELAGMPRDSLENLLGLPGAKGRMRPGPAALMKLPGLSALAVRLVTGSARMEREREALHARFMTFEQTRMDEISDDRLLEEIDTLIALGEESAYLNIVVPLLANLSIRSLGRHLEKVGVSIEDHPLAAGSDHDPTALLRRFGDRLSRLDDDARGAILDGDIDSLSADLRGELTEIVSRFGHLSENANDMSVPRWRDDEHLVIRLAWAAHGTSPEAGETLDEVVDEIGGWSGWSVRRAVRRAGAQSRLRNAVGSTFTYGYGLLRPRFLEIGSRLVARGLLDWAEDVFYLPRGTAERALHEPVPELRETVAAEKQSMAEAKDIVMPDLIVGDSWLPAPIDLADRLEGVGVSRGRYLGRARYVAHLGESHLLEEGDVLVVEHSDVAWTPLFSKAGAVVTAAGGLLAHSSITAREMGVPCVASVSHARLLDGHEVLVDGFEGVVLVHGSPDGSRSS